MIPSQPLRRALREKLASVPARHRFPDFAECARNGLCGILARESPTPNRRDLAPFDKINFSCRDAQARILELKPSREELLSSHRGFLSRSIGWLISGVWILGQVMLIAWATLAIYYSNLPWSGPRLALAGAFAVFAIWGFWLSRRRYMPVAVVVLFLAVVAWWISIAPSHDREWRPEVGCLELPP